MGRSILINGHKQKIETAPFWIESKLLLLLLSNDTESDNLVLDIPCDDEFVCFVLQFLRYGCVPRPIIEPLMYTSLTNAFDFLLCDKALLSLTLDDKKLNIFSREDLKINGDQNLLFELFDENGKWVDIDAKCLPYPHICKSKTHVLKRRPDNINRAIKRMFFCNICHRESFIKMVFTVFKGQLCIAGGCMQYMFRKRTHPDQYFCNNSDIDFFLINMNIVCLPLFIKAFAGVYQQFFGEYYIVRTKYCITFFKMRNAHQNIVQIVLRNFRGCSDVLNSFDLDSSCILYDGKKIFANSRGIRCIASSCNLVDINRQSTTFEKRLKKYFRKYDIGIAVPNYDKSRVQFSHATFGLSKLLTEKGQEIDSYGYTHGGIYLSTSIEKLKKNITNNLQYTSGIVTFLIRHNNPLVFEYFGNETAVLEQDFQIPSFGNYKKSFEPVKGPWYAQAYGGDFILSWKKQIDTAYQTYYLCTKFDVTSWRVELGPANDGLNVFIEHKL